MKKISIYQNVDIFVYSIRMAMAVRLCNGALLCNEINKNSIFLWSIVDILFE